MIGSTKADCPDELTLSIYADGELSGDEAARVGRHLDGCAACTTLLRSVEGENEMLREVLLESVSDALPETEFAVDSGASKHVEFGVRPRDARWAIAAAIAIAALTPFALEWAWQAVPSLPAELSWVGSVGSYGGAMSLSQALVRFFVGGQDMILSSFGFIATLVVVLGVLATMAARTRARQGAVAVAAFAVLLLGGLAPATDAHAAEFRVEEDGTVRVSEGETIEDTVFLGGNTAIMAGTIDGDLFAGAEQVEITGTVHGNVYTAGESVRVSGVVDGNLHAAGENVDVSTKLGGSGFLAGQRVMVNAEGDLARGAFVAGETVQSRGRVGRDLFFAADEMSIDGSVERNVSGYGTQVAVGSASTIGGDFTVTVPRDDAVEVRDGASIAGVTNINIDEEREHRAFVGVAFYLWMIAKALAMLLVGWLLVTVFPKLRPSVPESSGEVLKNMGVGFLALVATPVAIVLLLVTVIGIPIALALGMLYGMLLFLSTLVVADFVGQRFTFGGDTGTGDALRTGVALFAILFLTSIPFIGGGLNFLITILGAGVLLLHLHKLYQSRGSGGETPTGPAGPDMALPA